MNTLWIFGDSFSWEHKIRFKTYPESKTYDDQVWMYIDKHLDGKMFDCWGKQLADGLKMNYVNHASFQTNIHETENLNLSGGPTNDNNLILLSHLSKNFKRGDIVLFGFTDITRFDYVSPLGNTTIYSNSDELDNFEKWEREYIAQEIIQRDENPYYKDKLFNSLKVFEQLSNTVGFDLWYWDWTGIFDKLVYNKNISNERWIFFHAHPNYEDYGTMIWNDYKSGPICWETDYKNPDSHMGKVGNTIHAKVLLNFLKKNR